MCMWNYLHFRENSRILKNRLDIRSLTLKIFMNFICSMPSSDLELQDYEVWGKYFVQFPTWIQILPPGHRGWPLLVSYLEHRRPSWCFSLACWSKTTPAVVIKFTFIRECLLIGDFSSTQRWHFRSSAVIPLSQTVQNYCWFCSKYK